MNILTIDCDTFTNCYSYAKHMNHQIDAKDSWKIIDFLESTGKYGINTQVDIRYLSKTIDILKQKCVNADVRLIQEHHEIVGIMEELNCKDAFLYNIDEHFDISYGNDNSELNCENFVLHSRAKRLISNYTWLHTTTSDINCVGLSPFKFHMCHLEDIDISLLPAFDLVVVCVSHYFTPMKYWESLPKHLMNEIPKLEYFKEIDKNEMDMNVFNNDNLKDYLLDGTLPNIHRVFRYKDCYIIFEKECNGVSILNVGDSFNIQVGKEVVDLLLDEYKELSFTWVKGIRNEILIRKILKNYNKTMELYDDSDNTIMVKFTGGNE